ncbi:predicted protein [Histoplasma capsulatum H143]|uniref:Uncharacterized protein n=2 Tax=Ajellomyces capsulatus TaxID=5037 RepID=C6HHH9_AJECH|nr:predicted protein [Histoplasma capsulatum H143]
MSSTISNCVSMDILFNHPLPAVVSKLGFRSQAQTVTPPYVGPAIFMSRPSIIFQAARKNKIYCLLLRVNAEAPAPGKPRDARSEQRKFLGAVSLETGEQIRQPSSDLSLLIDQQRFRSCGNIGVSGIYSAG